MEIAKSQGFVPHGSFQSLSRPAQHLACPPYPGYLPAARDVVLLSSSWLFQAVSSPHRHQAYLKDQGHRKGGSFSVFLLFVCRPLFWRATLPIGGREQSRFGWEWRGNVFSVDNRRVDENFEMGVVRHERGLEDFDMGVESWII